ncbi:hypothetical protein D1AOALGA4SA_2392 [Olavius algarvensis Delta 1 endosymbiont]|nr:hypothetical protein D1AOALGA4SA_2392 [Olavius algarvensis Delta 1 endosymbiont]
MIFPIRDFMGYLLSLFVNLAHKTNGTAKGLHFFIHLPFKDFCKK